MKTLLALCLLTVPLAASAQLRIRVITPDGTTETATINNTNLIARLTEHAANYDGANVADRLARRLEFLLREDERATRRATLERVARDEYIRRISELEE